MAGEEPGTGSADVCKLLQPAKSPGVTGTLLAESEEEVELANNNTVRPKAQGGLLFLVQNEGGGRGLVSSLAPLIVSVGSKTLSWVEVRTKLLS